MTKVQTNAQGKVYITSGGKALLSSGGSDTIYLPNNSGSTITAGDKVLFTLGTSDSAGAETFTTAYNSTLPTFNPVCVLDNNSFIVSSRYAQYSFNGYLFSKTNNTWSQGSINSNYANVGMPNVVFQYFDNGYISSPSFNGQTAYLVTAAGTSIAVNTNYRYIGDYSDTSYVSYSGSAAYICKWNKTNNTATEVLTIYDFGDYYGLCRIFGSRLFICHSQYYKIYTISDTDTFTLLSQGNIGTNSGLRFIGATGLATGDVLFVVNNYTANYNDQYAANNPSATSCLFCYKVQSDGSLAYYEEPQLKLFESTPCYVAYDNRSNILSIGTKDEVYFYEFDTTNKSFNRISVYHTSLPTPASNVPLRVQMTPDKSTFVVYGYSSSANPVYVYTNTESYQRIVPNSAYNYDLVTSFTGIATGETDTDGNYEIKTVLPNVVDSKIITNLEPDEVIIKGGAE